MHPKFTLLTLVLSVFILTSCKPATPEPTATLDPALLRTAAAQTADAFMTATAQAMPTQTATSTPDLLQTAAVQTQAALQTQIAAVTATPTSGVTPTIDQSLIDRAVLVADVTVPDGTDFKPNESFTKTWRLQNNGTSTWNTSYALVFVSGDRMSGPDRVALNTSVLPGRQVDISVKLTAPTQPGRYRGYWKMANSANKLFDEIIWVEIDVVSGDTSTPGTVTTTVTPGAVTISGLTMSVDTASFSGACPHTFTYTAKFTLSAPATVTYQLEAGAETPGYTFTLPPAQTTTFTAGEQTLIFTLELAQSVTGWVRLHITSPADVASNQAVFTLNCQP